MSALREEDFQNKKVDLSMWRKLMVYVRPYVPKMVLIAALMMLSGVMDVAFPRLTAFVIDHHITVGVLQGIWKPAVLFLVLTVFASLNVLLFVRLASQVEAYVCRDIRRSSFKKLQEISFSYYDKTPVGYIMARVTSDISRISETIAWTLVDQMWGLTYMITAIIGMLAVNWRMALLVIGSIPFLVVISIFFQKHILQAHRNVRQQNSKVTGAFNEGIMGARTTKTLGREELNYQEFSAITGKMRSNAVRAAFLSSVFTPIVMTIGAISTSLVLWRGGVVVQIGGMSLGDLTFFLSLASWFFEPVREFSRLFAELQSAQASVERVVKLLDTQPEIQDKPAVLETFGDAFHPKRENWPTIRGDIEFEHVSFAYKDGSNVLDDFSLKIQAGQMIALVGETGSGKSTIVNLICRFYEPTSGRILIDGVDYRERSQLWLHSNLGYVLQAPQLFSGTIMDNIRYGKLDATDEEVIEAARTVNAHTFIERLPNAYHTEVWEGGGRLSTGEKQLISFARAIIARPPIFVLDEATSSIDTQTEHIIQDAIETLLQDRTSFIIAHRLSTVRRADRILVIRSGRVVESGTHRQLMRLRGYYYQLYTAQFRESAQNRLLSAQA